MMSSSARVTIELAPGSRRRCRGGAIIQSRRSSGLSEASSRALRWPEWHGRTESTRIRFSLGGVCTNAAPGRKRAPGANGRTAAGDDFRFASCSGSGAEPVVYAAGTIQLQLPRGRLRTEGAVDPDSLRVVLECLLA